MSRIKKSQIHCRAVSDAELEQDLQPALEARRELLAMGTFLRLSDSERKIWQGYADFIKQFGQPLIYQLDDFAKATFYAKKLGLPVPEQPETPQRKRRAIQPASSIIPG